MNDKAFLSTTHPVYDANIDLWLRNERRLRGGRNVAQDLTPYQWEKPNGEHLKRRKERCVYINLPARAGSTMVGQLRRNAPEIGKGLDYGFLGNPNDEDTRAFQFTNSVDKTDGTGMSWGTFWDRVHINAWATGHRWIMADAPEWHGDDLPSREDEQNGFRPYITEYSPTAVKNWWLDSRGLAMLRIELFKRVPRFEDGQYTEKPMKVNLFMVRTGVEVFGEDYAGGGWWKYDEDDNLITDAEGNEQKGTWDATGGKIPAVCLYYERDHVTGESTEENEVIPSISRPGMTELGNLAVEHMDLVSTMKHDAFYSGSRLLLLINAAKFQHNFVVERLNKGSQVISVPPPKDPEAPPVKAQDSANSSANEALASALKDLREQASIIAFEEITHVPEASGISKQFSFRNGKSPRLALMASEREGPERDLIRFVEMLWGADTPTGSVRWTRDFDLQTAKDDVKQVFEAMTEIGVYSKTLITDGVMRLAREVGMLESKTEEEQQTIRDEVEASVDQLLQGNAEVGDFFSTAQAA